MLFVASFLTKAKTKRTWEVEKPTALVLLITGMVYNPAVASLLTVFSFVTQSSLTAGDLVALRCVAFVFEKRMQ